MSVGPLISVVSPIYGCRDCLEKLVERVSQSFRDTGLDWEFVLIDDRGPDHPWSLIEEIAAREPRVRGVRLSRNHGQHLAIWAGLRESRGAWVAVIDCDLQDDPKIIPELYVKALAEGADAVVVDRGSWKDTGFRRFASRTMYKLIELLAGIRVENNIGNFGIYSRRLVDILLSYQEKEVFFPVMVTITGLPKITYTADRAERLSGRTSYSLKHLLNLAIAILIRFSDRPLKLSVIFGLAFSGFSALVSIFLIFAYVTGAFSVPGWTSLILSVWFLAGFILAVLGVHGFYIGRIFAEVQNRPRILVESRTDTKQTK